MRLSYLFCVENIPDEFVTTGKSDAVPVDLALAPHCLAADTGPAARLKIREEFGQISLVLSGSDTRAEGDRCANALCSSSEIALMLRVVVEAVCIPPCYSGMHWPTNNVSDAARCGSVSGL
jgi:hypothetical protein